LHGQVQILWIKRRETFVEDDQFGVLQQRARDVDAAFLSMR
jgi:hypothetical protein